jgi:RNA polymerase II-associated protein 1
MSSSQTSGNGGLDDDAFLRAAQEEFVSSGAQPAAKTLRTTQRNVKPRNEETVEEDYGSSGSGWYQQMKGVRFRLDDLEDGGQETYERLSPERKSVKVPEEKDIHESGAMMGDILERKTSAAPPVFMRKGSRRSGGFPAPMTFSRAVKTRETDLADEEKEDLMQRLEGRELMEEIDRENREKLARMSEEEILELQRSLKASLPSGLQKKLLSKSSESSTKREESEPSSIPAESIYSKSKPPSPPVEDQSFDEHLRSFFPTNATSVGQPEWTLPVHPAEETFYSIPDTTSPQASAMRFDFKGNYIPPETSRSLPTHLGLHHHSLDPGSAGYTLAELAILARSVQPSQKCIALKIMGFILADVAKGKYDWNVTEGLWDEIEQERIIEILIDIAKGGREAGGNRSVQRYAEDAVTRWVNANGPKLWEERLQKKGYERIP